MSTSSKLIIGFFVVLSAQAKAQDPDAAIVHGPTQRIEALERAAGQGGRPNLSSASAPAPFLGVDDLKPQLSRHERLLDLANARIIKLAERLEAVERRLGQFEAATKTRTLGPNYHHPAPAPKPLP